MVGRQQVLCFHIYECNSRWNAYWKPYLFYFLVDFRPYLRNKIDQFQINTN